MPRKRTDRISFAPDEDVLKILKDLHNKDKFINEAVRSYLCRPSEITVEEMRAIIRNEMEAYVEEQHHGARI